GTHLESEFEIVGTYTRDLPYGYDSLVENLIDVSHVPFAHHGLQGTRDDAAPVSMTIPEMKGSDQQGDLLNFTFWDRTMRMRREAQFFLRSPFFFFYLGEFLGDKDNEEYKQFTARRGADPDGKPRFRLNCACVPVAPGWSRLILCDASVPGTGGVRSVLERLGIRGQIPPWVIHLLSNRFLDSDLAFLHHQERKLRQGPDGCTAWNKAYYMPGEADRSISAWRQWLSKVLSSWTSAMKTAVRPATCVAEEGPSAGGGTPMLLFLVGQIQEQAEHRVPKWTALPANWIVAVGTGASVDRIRCASQGLHFIAAA
ncbi:unnamed protein product, partial [Effrenium voratum]